MRRSINPTGARWALAASAAFALAAGCQVPSAHTFSRNFFTRPEVPVDAPAACPPRHCDQCTNGGRLFKFYCGSCHNARPLGERPFSNYEVAVAHMRDQAYLTGMEYRQIIHFMRRWHDIGPATPPVTPSPKRFHPAQPVTELRKDSASASAAPLPPLPEGPGPWQSSEPNAAPPAPPASDLPAAIDE